MNTGGALYWTLWVLSLRRPKHVCQLKLFVAVACHWLPTLAPPQRVLYKRRRQTARQIPFFSCEESTSKASSAFLKAASKRALASCAFLKAMQRSPSRMRRSGWPPPPRRTTRSGFHGPDPAGFQREDDEEEADTSLLFLIPLVRFISGRLPRGRDAAAEA